MLIIKSLGSVLFILQRWGCCSLCVREMKPFNKTSIWLFSSNTLIINVRAYILLIQKQAKKLKKAAKKARKKEKKEERRRAAALDDKKRQR